MAIKYPQYNYGTGRRKSAIARVFLKAGTGDIVVNDKPIDVFFRAKPVVWWCVSPWS